MKMHRTLVCLATALFAAATVQADDLPPTPRYPLWLNECGGCHVAYPPALLTAPAWRTVMAGLDRHFGSDASLDETTRADLTRFLETHAARSPRLAARDGRITGTAWFRHEHDELPARMRTAGVKSMAQCEACHAGAARGDYDEDRVRVPGYRASR